MRTMLKRMPRCLEKTNKVMKVRRCYITLMELMIVITILIMLTGVVGINIRRALQQQRFRTEVDLMVDTLRLAQDLMLILGADVSLRMWGERQKGIQYRLDVEGDIPEAWEPVIKRSHRRLREIHFVDFADGESVEGRIDIRFFSGGSVMSRGVLRLSTHENPKDPGALKRVVFLRGYPHPIVSIPEGEELLELEDEEDDEFINRLTTYTTQEILEDEPPKETPQPEEEPEKQEKAKKEEGS